jgi:hypothetical protein
MANAVISVDFVLPGAYIFSLITIWNSFEYHDKESLTSEGS